MFSMLTSITYLPSAALFHPLSSDYWGEVTGDGILYTSTPHLNSGGGGGGWVRVNSVSSSFYIYILFQHTAG